MSQVSLEVTDPFPQLVRLAMKTEEPPTKIPRLEERGENDILWTHQEKRLPFGRWEDKDVDPHYLDLHDIPLCFRMEAFNQTQQSETSDTIILAKDLIPVVIYELEKLKRINTRFGMALLAYIKVSDGGRKLFLP